MLHPDKSLKRLTVTIKDLLYAGGSWLQFDNVQRAMPWISCWIETKPTYCIGKHRLNVMLAILLTHMLFSVMIHMIGVFPSVYFLSLACGSVVSPSLPAMSKNLMSSTYLIHHIILLTAFLWRCCCCIFIISLNLKLLLHDNFMPFWNRVLLVCMIRANIHLKFYASSHIKLLCLRTWWCRFYWFKI